MWLSLSREAGGSATLREVSHAGEVLQTIALTDPDGVFDVAVDDDGYVVTTEQFSSALTKRSPSGDVLWSHPRDGLPSEVEIVNDDSSVVSIAVDSDGSLVSRHYR